MKFLILSLALIAVASAQRQFGHYQATHHQTAHHQATHHQSGATVSHSVAPAHPVVSSSGSEPIAIVHQSQDVAPDGSYNFQYETANGISASASGSPGPVNEDGEAAVVTKGSYQYVAPDGTTITVTYVADQNGFQPQGAHLPVAPAIPAQIQRALEFIAAHPVKSEKERSGL